MSNPVYNMVLEKSGIQLIPGMKIDQISGNLDELYGHMETSNRINRGVFKEQEWVAGYATMYSREAIDKVGMFDTRFRNAGFVFVFHINITADKDRRQAPAKSNGYRFLCRVSVDMLGAWALVALPLPRRHQARWRQKKPTI